MIFRFSLILNVILIIGLILIAYKLRSKIYNRIKSQDSYNIVMIGDGYTARINWNKDLNRIDIKNSGAGGYTTSQYQRHLNDLVIKYNPKICFIEGGINDLLIGIPLNRIFINYQSILDSLLKNKIDPVVQSIFPLGTPSNYPSANETNLINSRVDSLNIYLSRLANKKGVRYIDLNKYLSVDGKLKKEISTDGVHLNELGKKIWIREVDKILNTKGL